MSNLVATILTAGLFIFVLVGLPWLRHERDLEREAASRPDPAKLAALHKESKARMESEEWGLAAARTRQLLDRDPDNPVYLLQMAEALGHQGRSAEEATTWESYVLVSPTPWFACPRMAQAWRKAGQEARAMAAFERCYRLAPQNSDVIFFLAREYEKKRNWREAKELYEKGLELSPDYVDLRLGVGRMLLVEEKPADAEAAALAVLTANPDNPDALLLLGSARRELGDVAGARADLERGLALAPGYSDFHFLLGRLAEDEGLRDEALRWYREALVISPGRADAAERVALLERGGA